MTSSIVLRPPRTLSSGPPLPATLPSMHPSRSRPPAPRCLAAEGLEGTPPSQLLPVFVSLGDYDNVYDMRHVAHKMLSYPLIKFEVGSWMLAGQGV